MRGIKPMKLSLVTRPFSMGRAHYLGVGVMAYFPLDAEPGLLTEIELWSEVMEVLGDVPPDLGIPKSRSEYLVVGSAHQPGGEPGELRHVRVKVGELEKSVYVIGDRVWDDGVPTKPTEFTSMPMTWDRAFGGEKFERNPIGKGLVEREEELAPMPNLELPGQMIDELDDAPDPAGFGPIDFMRPQRFSLAGTYDKEWLDTCFPGYPKDMDWRIWNLASADQQQEAPFRGDEEILVEHMHPSVPNMRGKLPGLRAVCYVQQQGWLKEVETRLTTIWVLPEIKRGIAIYHGALPVAEDDADDVDTILIAAEKLDAPPRGEAHYRQVMQKRTGPKRGFEILKDRDLLPEEFGPLPTLDDAMALTTHEGLRKGRQLEAFEKSIEEARADLVARGLDPDLHGPAGMPAEEELPPLEEMGDYLDKMLEQGEQRRQDAEVERERNNERLLAFCEEMGVDYESIQEEMKSPPRGPPTFTADGQRAKVQRVIDELAEQGTTVDELEYWVTADEPYQEWLSAELQLREAYRVSAQHQLPAFAAPTNAGAERRAEVERAVRAGESLAQWDLTGVDLSGMTLSGVDFSGAFLESVNFSACTLDGASFENAVLAHANLRGASLENIRATGANLGGASVESADLDGAVLRGTILTGASFVGSSMTDVDLTSSVLDRCVIERVDFSRAVLARCTFQEVSLREVIFTRADLEWATFIKCDMSGLDFSGARLDNATLYESVADDANLAGVHAKALRVVGASSMKRVDFTGAVLDRATMREVSFEGADFSGAKLNEADLSKADFTGARLYRVVARQSMWIRACLRGAMAVSIDLFDAIVEKADLRGADLRGANLYGADFALVRADAETSVAEAIQDRVRTQPLYEAPPT